MKKKHKRPWAVFIAIFLAVLFGSLVGTEGGIFGVSFYSIVNVIGIIFLNALTLVVVPLVSASIITGMYRIGGDGRFGQIGGKMFGFYLGTSLIAILIGLLFVNLIGPGIGQAPPTVAMVGEKFQQGLANSQGDIFVRFLISIVPSNVLAAFSQGEMLGLIFFSLIFGFAMSKISPNPASTLNGFFEGVFQTMIQVTHLIMKFLPIGVFCLVAKVFMTSGIRSLQSVGLFFATAVIGLAIFMFIALPLLLKFVARVNPLRHFKAMSPALVTAFSTSSSSASLPVTMDCVEKRAGVSNRICSLVVPLGTSINMSGSALYTCVATMFVAQAYQIDLSFTTQFLIVFLSLITTIGVAGVPSGSLVTILILLRAIGLPPEGIGLFVAVDRLLDMCRSTVNVFSDSCCAVLVARSEGEKNVLAKEI